MSNAIAERPSPIEIGLLAFPRLTQLDLTGPYETLARIPNARVHIVARTREAVAADTGLILTPTVCYADCPPLDVVCVPGGPGVNEAMLDPPTLSFLRAQAAGARYVTSVCSGALILGAAGLLRGYRATTHWASLEFLRPFGAIPARERVCVDRNRITGGGVTAGIDFGLHLARVLASEAIAQRIQLYLEYAPAPPFDAGSPESAPDMVRAAYEQSSAPMLKQRAAAVKRAAAALDK
jgi:cyclohexyl-isocyanide hydratase